ncbi:hypothetical protein AX15_007333 [Amanita polypyramis BW_CC]|nr:hypothetical protein AX15_007333 [Amanita polypyramis BW_CC]
MVWTQDTEPCHDHKEDALACIEFLKTTTVVGCMSDTDVVKGLLGIIPSRDGDGDDKDEWTGVGNADSSGGEADSNMDKDGEWDVDDDIEDAEGPSYTGFDDDNDKRRNKQMQSPEKIFKPSSRPSLLGGICFSKGATRCSKKDIR